MINQSNHTILIIDEVHEVFLEKLKNINITYVPDVTLDELPELLRDATPIRKDPKVKQFKMADLYEEEVDDQGDLTGNYLFKFKQKAVINTRAGTALNMKVALFDSQKKPTDVSIGGGSVIRVAATAIGYAMPSTKMVGLSLRPSAIQIIELSGGAGAGADAFAVEDGFVGDGVTETKDEVPVFHGEDDADF